MSSLTNKTEVQATSVAANQVEKKVDLTDGRTIIVPLGWFPRLRHATQNERNHWRLISHGAGIHWPNLDEDISVRNLLDGQPSGESQRSFQRWLAARAPAKKRQG